MDLLLLRRSIPHLLALGFAQQGGAGPATNSPEPQLSMPLMGLPPFAPLLPQVMGEYGSEREAVRANDLLSMSHLSTAAQLRAYLQQQAGLSDDGMEAGEQQQQQQQQGGLRVQRALQCRSLPPPVCWLPAKVGEAGWAGS
jgi:hypothetical protein